MPFARGTSISGLQAATSPPDDRRGDAATVARRHVV